MRDRGPLWFFSHGWDLYTDFVDVYDCSLHLPRCACFMLNQRAPVEVVFIQMDFLGHRGFLFEL